VIILQCVACVTPISAYPVLSIIHTPSITAPSPLPPLPHSILITPYSLPTHPHTYPYLHSPRTPAHPTPQEHTQQLKVESFEEENIVLKQALQGLKDRLAATTHDMHALYQLKNVSEGEIDAQTKRLRDLEMALMERKGRVLFCIS
jgi:hypothetical protein